MTEDKAMPSEAEYQEAFERARAAFTAVLDSLLGTPVEAVVAIGIVKYDGTSMFEVAHSSHCIGCAAGIAIKAAAVLRDTAVNEAVKAEAAPLAN